MAAWLPIVLVPELQMLPFIMIIRTVSRLFTKTFSEHVLMTASLSLECRNLRALDKILNTKITYTDEGGMFLSKFLMS